MKCLNQEELTCVCGGTGVLGIAAFSTIGGGLGAWYGYTCALQGVTRLPRMSGTVRAQHIIRSRLFSGALIGILLGALVGLSMSAFEEASL